MDNTARIEALSPQVSYHVDECEVIELMPYEDEVELLFCNFVDDIDAWARQAQAAEMAVDESSGIKGRRFCRG